MNPQEKKRYIDECYDEYKSAISGIKISSLTEFSNFKRNPNKEILLQPKKYQKAGKGNLSKEIEIEIPLYHKKRDEKIVRKEADTNQAKDPAVIAPNLNELKPMMAPPRPVNKDNTSQVSQLQQLR